MTASDPVSPRQCSSSSTNRELVEIIEKEGSSEPSFSFPPLPPFPYSGTLYLYPRERDREMDRQALSYRMDSESQALFIRRIELAQKTMLHSQYPWWTDFCAKEISYCSQMLCGVRPYQWADYDREMVK